MYTEYKWNGYPCKNCSIISAEQ